ncbi:MAG: hypothetical protein HKN25_02200 [Pyrinomonadaceae bacterium]|nr:hypothetical protein [Pyrinomonadaceae bacterium]
MAGKLEVSFNSPQCGWMSIGFEDGSNEFHTTTAHAPYSNALSELLNTLTSLLDDSKADYSHTLKWNRDPEAFDFIFSRAGNDTSIEILEYPTEKRDPEKMETVYQFTGDARQIVEAFHETFQQLYDERNVDEFEDNWHQKFPLAEFEKLSSRLK